MDISGAVNFIRGRKPFVIVILILAMTAWFVMLPGMKGNYDSLKAGYPLSSFRSEYMMYNGAWYIDQDMETGAEGTIVALHGPTMPMKRGSYLLEIWYECNETQNFLPYAEEGNIALIEAQEALLDRNLNYVSYHFDITEDIDNFEVGIGYNQTGYLLVKDIRIKSDNAAAKRMWVMALLIALAVNVLFWNIESIKKNRSTIILLIAMVFFVSIPLFHQGMSKGHDMRFHVMRIEGLMQEVLAGHIPVKISSAWAAGYGYPVSVYYGDIFLYFPVLLRLMGFTIMVAFKAYVVLVNAATVIIAYACFGQVFKRKELALLCTFVYSTSAYRLMDIYVRSALGEYSAMTFLPLVMLAIYRMYTENHTEPRSIGKNAAILAVGMTGIVETHLLSVEMVVLMLLLLCMVLWRKTLRLATIKTYLLAAAETIMLNLFFFVPFLDYYLNVDVRINHQTLGEDTRKIQRIGAYIFQYFSFFQNPFGENGDIMGERMLMTPGILLMTALVLAIYLWLCGRADQKIKLTTGFSIFTLWVASDLFPWRFIVMRGGRIGLLLAQVQFPWRYIGIAIVFLALLTGFIIERIVKDWDPARERTILICIAFIGLFSNCIFYSQISDELLIANLRDTPEVDLYTPFSSGEYLRRVSNFHDLSYLKTSYDAQNVNELKLLDRKGTDIVLYCETGDQPGLISVPMFHYKGYVVRDGSGNEYPIMDGEESRITFEVPVEYAGQITIAFCEPWYWRLAEIISLISLVSLCGWGYVTFGRNHVQKKEQHTGVQILSDHQFNSIT